MLQYSLFADNPGKADGREGAKGECLAWQMRLPRVELNH